jgi:xanthine dehydrogenase accessory factor
MENLDVSVLRQLLQWRRAGQRAVLATVIRTWGSSPRPIGSIMALSESGSVIGSVSGGCIEDDLIARFRPTNADNAHAAQGELISDGPPQRVRYGVTADEAHRFGLPCGGTLELLLEFNPDVVALEQLVGELEQGRLVRRDTEIATGRVLVQPVAQPSVLVDDGVWLRNSFGPEFRMLLIGAGQLSECLATMALFCGFAVTVCDPREEYRGHWAVANARLVTGMPDDVVREMVPDRRTAVIALTHDPKLDDLALLEALASDAFYVGAIGSRRNNEARRTRMIEHFEQTAESLSHLRGPVGLFIGSKTPPEIAVSIMAEVLAVKNGVELPDRLRVGPAKQQRAIAENDPGIMPCKLG